MWWTFLRPYKILIGALPNVIFKILRKTYSYRETATQLQSTIRKHWKGYRLFLAWIKFGLLTLLNNSYYPMNEHTVVRFAVGYDVDNQGQRHSVGSNFQRVGSLYVQKSSLKFCLPEAPIHLRTQWGCTVEILLHFVERGLKRRTSKCIQRVERIHLATWIRGYIEFKRQLH